MEKRLSIVLAATLLLFATAALANTKWHGYVPKHKTVQAKVMKMSGPKEIAGITKKLSIAIGKHAQWFREYVQNAPAGKPLSYHKNFGISHHEYDLYLKTLNHLQMKQIGNIELSFVPIGDHEIQLKTKPDCPINGIIISDQVVTAEPNQLYMRNEIHNHDKNSATGPWEGWQWKLQEYDQKALKGKSIKFAIGALQKSGEGIIYFDLKDIDIHAKKKKMVSYTVYYPIGEK